MPLSRAAVERLFREWDPASVADGAPEEYHGVASIAFAMLKAGEAPNAIAERVFGELESVWEVHPSRADLAARLQELLDD